MVKEGTEKLETSEKGFEKSLEICQRLERERWKRRGIITNLEGSSVRKQRERKKG